MDFPLEIILNIAKFLDKQSFGAFAKTCSDFSGVGRGTHKKQAQERFCAAKLQKQVDFYFLCLEQNLAVVSVAVNRTQNQDVARAGDIITQREQQRDWTTLTPLGLKVLSDTRILQFMSAEKVEEYRARFIKAVGRRPIGQVKHLFYLVIHKQKVLVHYLSQMPRPYAQHKRSLVINFLKLTQTRSNGLFYLATGIKISLTNLLILYPFISLNMIINKNKMRFEFLVFSNF